MRHLTEYTEGGIYAQFQLEELSSKMKVELNISKKVKVGDAIEVANEVATFIFVCTKLDERPDCSANYYKLAQVIKHLTIEVGAEIIVDCNFKNAYKQGDVATLTKDEGASVWWAKFPTGIWNVGYGHDFFVIKST